MRNENPLLWYHLVGSTRHRFTRLRVVYYSIGVVLILVYMTTFLMIVNLRLGITETFFLILFVVCLITPLFSYNLFSSEYEKATWEFLALTRLTAKEIVLGKWDVGLIRLVVLLAALFPLGLASSALMPASHDFMTHLILGTLCIGCWGVLLISAGTWLSFRWRSTVLSASLLYALQVFVLLLLPSLVGILTYEPWVDFLGTMLQDDFSSFASRAYFWLASVTNGQCLVWLNPFYTLGEMGTMFGRYDEIAQGMHAVGWGLVQSGVYLLLAAGFLWLTHNGVKKCWRK